VAALASLRRAATARLTALLLLAAPAAALADYPFPTSLAERQKAEEIAKAVAAGDQKAVEALTTLLDEQNPRVQAAALVGLLQLSHNELDFSQPLARVGAWRGPRPAFIRAALKAAAVALDHQVPIRQRFAQLIELTQSDGGFERRMAVEALRGQREHRDYRQDKVLKALEAMANDKFEDGDADFDGLAVGRVAFEVWWASRSKGMDLDERPPILVQTLALGEPYGSRWCHAACELLAKEGQAALAVLLPLLEGKDSRSKMWAMLALREIGGAEAIRACQDVWVKDLDSKDWLEKRTARDGLLRHPDRRALPRFVREAVKDDELYAAWKAAYDLDKLDEEEALRELRKAAEDPREIVRTQAAAQLAHRGQGGGELTILTGITSDTDIVRLVARWGLPHLPDRKKVNDFLIGLLKVKPGEDKLPERKREVLRHARLDALQDFYAWDRDRQEHRPLLYVIRDLLADSRYAGHAARILRKLGYQVEWSDGRYKVVGEPRS